MENQTVTKCLEEARATLGTSLAWRRLNALFDAGSFTELDAFSKNSEHGCEVITGYGSVAGAPVVAFSQNIEADGGAMGRAQAAKIARVYELAEKSGFPVVGIYDSNGAHLTEGLDALDAYSRLTQSVGRLSGVVPQISLVLGTCAGSGALMAASADVVIISKEAKMYLTAPSIIGGEKEGAGSALSVCQSGTAQVLAEDESEAIESARTLLSMLPSNNLADVPLYEGVEANPGEMLCTHLVDADSAFALSKEFAPAIRTGLARIMGMPVGLFATAAE